MLLAQAAGGIDAAQALVGLPVAVVVVVLFLGAWRLNSRGELVTGREHREIIGHVTARMEQVERERDMALAELARWQDIGLRALNVSEAALGRQGGT